MVNSTLNVLEKNICGGEMTIPPEYHTEALSLSRGYTPSQWLKKQMKQKSRRLLDWIQGRIKLFKIGLMLS